MAPRSRFDIADVRRAAALASLALSPREFERYAEELAPVLAEFERIEPPASSPDVASRDRHHAPGLRPDTPDPDALHHRPAELAPDWHEGFFVAPRPPAMDT